jgi:hypothetical protein
LEVAGEEAKGEAVEGDGDAGAVGLDGAGVGFVTDFGAGDFGVGARAVD